MSAELEATCLGLAAAIEGKLKDHCYSAVHDIIFYGRIATALAEAAAHFRLLETQATCSEPTWGLCRFHAEAVRVVRANCAECEDGGAA